MSRVLGQVVWILRKDLLIEWRARARPFALACFAATVLLLFSFAVGPDTVTLRKNAGGYLWLALLFSSTALLGQSVRVEEEAGARDALLLTPVAPAAIFYGKALANALQLALLAAVILPITLALCDASIKESGAVLAAAVLLGSLGLSGPGTLYSALTARIHSQQLLLPLLLFPLIVPALVAAVSTTSLVLSGDPMGQSGSWLALLTCFDLVYWAVCGVLFARVIEE